MNWIAVAGDVTASFERLQRPAEAEFASFGRSLGDIVFQHELEMCFVGQGYELLAAVDLTRLKSEGCNYVEALFRTTHESRYGTIATMDAVEIVTLRLTASRCRPGPRS